MRRSRAQWRELVASWRQSGVSASDFARQEGLNPNNVRLVAERARA